MAICTGCNRKHPNDESAVLCVIQSEKIRRLPDHELMAEAIYLQREVAESHRETQQWELSCYQAEIKRRQRLAKRVPFIDKPGITPELIDEIKRRATGPDFVEIAERQASACSVKRGKIYWLPCPVHHEKSPSFAIYPDQGRVHCYGCNFDADVFGLFTNMPPSLSFIEAVKEVARFVHVEIPEYKPAVKPPYPNRGIA